MYSRAKHQPETLSPEAHNSQPESLFPLGSKLETLGLQRFRV